MLHKVRIGHFTVDEIGRKRPAFTEVIVGADSGDAAAEVALATYGRDLANPPGSSYEMKVGVCGIDTPTVEERAAWEAGRRPKTEVHTATGHQDEFTARRADVEAPAEPDNDWKAEVAEMSATEPKSDRMAAARAAKAAKKAQAAE